MNKIRLELIGITYNQIESGVYAVILEEEGGPRRIPIIIGFPEAQAIECKLQEVVTPRPLTHDLMVNTLSAFDIRLLEVNIYRLPNGVFAAELMFEDGKAMRVIDSRSSDAIALAIRTGAPIYTTEDVLEEAGFEPGQPDKRSRKTQSKTITAKKENAATQRDITTLSLEELSIEMQKAAEAEDYERAARIKAEIDNRKNDSKSML